MIEKILIENKMKNIEKPWDPIEIVEFNNQVIRLALFFGEYHWHKHDSEDECFIVFQGKITIELKNHPAIELEAGECVIIPKGFEHKPKSKEKAYVLLIEPKTLKSKGD